MRTYQRATRLMLTCACLLLVAASPLPAAPDAPEAASPQEVMAEVMRMADAIHQRVEALAADSPHPLFTKHLRGVDALVKTDVIRCSLLIKTNPEIVGLSPTHMQKILDGLNGDAGKWDSYAAGKRSLIIAFVSKSDRSMQFYSLKLPRDWDPAKAYPTLLYLHGHIKNPAPVQFMGWSFGPGRPASTKPAAEANPLPPYVSIGPWGRGNTGYRDGWEADVWEALTDAKTLVKVDPDRLSLSGHSMGGFGSWSIAVRAPDVWSAVCIYAGGDRYAPAGSGLAGNLGDIPVRIWHGAKDRSVPEAMGQAIATELRKYGNEPIVDIDPDAGHMPSKSGKAAAKAWLLQQTRQRPASFTYIADGARHRGAWGVELRYNLAKDPMPRFTCTVEGQTVTIDSTGTTGLDVQLGEGGLGLTGEVTVIWNGEQAHKGPAEDVRLGDGARRRWSRSRKR